MCSDLNQSPLDSLFLPQLPKLSVGKIIQILSLWNHRSACAHDCLEIEFINVGNRKVSSFCVELVLIKRRRTAVNLVTSHLIVLHYEFKDGYETLVIRNENFWNKWPYLITTSGFEEENFGIGLTGELEKIYRVRDEFILGAGVELPDFVDVVGCTVLPCSIVRGEDVVMYMNFTANQFVDTLKVKVIANVFEQEIDYPFLPEKDGCKALTNTHCPLEINEPAQYKLVMPILAVFPQVSITLTLYLEGNGIPGNKVACFEIEANVI
ncbi:hypothetical protein FQA39_LY10953 [Lamprigera yunnana]|nr:hypothetical protein FQA39_LY10953 [Lamprigera yunnana]